MRRSVFTGLGSSLAIAMASSVMLLPLARAEIRSRMPRTEKKQKTQVRAPAPDPRSDDRAAVARQAAKEREIGVDPKYLSAAARRRSGVKRGDWIKASAKWDLDNPIEKWRWR